MIVFTDEERYCTFCACPMVENAVWTCIHYVYAMMTHALFNLYWLLCSLTCLYTSFHLFLFYCLLLFLVVLILYHVKLMSLIPLLHRWDIIAEKLGFMLVFGDLVWIPFTFSIQVRNHAFKPSHDVYIFLVFFV